MTENLNIYTEVISFVFLIFIMIEKKSRTKSENVERPIDMVEDHKKFVIRRNGYEKIVGQEKICQGDIVYIEEGDSLKFDGIILEIVERSVEKNEAEGSFVYIN